LLVYLIYTENSNRLKMPTIPGFRLAGKVFKHIPFAGDVGVGVAQLYNPDEASAAQRILNALIIGGGGAAASAATGGMDFIPAVVGSVADTPLENVNAETILRRLAYKLGQGKDPGTTTGQQIERIREWSKNKRRERGPEYEKVPLMF
jgi:hypothetical protein